MTGRHARYQPVLPLGHGGMGTVEVALRREGAFHRLYAVKRPHAVLLRDPAAAAMFLEEARLAGLIRHPNVAGVLDVIADERGPALVMEYVEGLPLSAVIGRARDGEDPLPLGVCLTIAAQAARGLQAAHDLVSDTGERLHLVHRDVSPQNILVGYDGVVRVTDFGVAKALGASGETAVGLVKGNPGYVAPEALRFEDVDARADLFSLGVVLYEMLTGARLYPAHSGVVSARRILHEAPPDVLEQRADVPPEIVALLFRLLAKAPADRPQSAAEVAAALAHALHDRCAPDETDVAAFLASRFAEERARRATDVAKGVRRVLASATAVRRRRVVAGAAATVALGGGLAAVAAWPRAESVAVKGLEGEYFAGAEFNEKRTTRVDFEIAFFWHDNPPHEAVPNRKYSIRWTGKLRAPATAATTVCLKSDDGARLWIDGRLVISDWAVRPMSRNCALVPLRKDHRHDLRLEYFQDGGEAGITLEWEDPRDPGKIVPVPAAHLYRR